MEFVIFLLFGLIPAIIAHTKSRSFWGWWLYGFVLFPIALVHVLFKDDSLHREVRFDDRSAPRRLVRDRPEILAAY
jgi:hypothetical protein